jgi:hypothetical protein
MYLETQDIHLERHPWDNIPDKIDLFDMTFPQLYRYHPGQYHSCLLYSASISKRNNYLQNANE